MSTEKSMNTPTKLCPTCGTRLSIDARRCLVCGTDLTVSEKSNKSARSVQANRLPEITLNLPSAFGLLLLFIAIGAVVVYFALGRRTNAIAQPTLTSTITSTATASLTSTPFTPTSTNTPEPTPTPFSYIVKLGDNCLSIAFGFRVSVQSIVLLNNLPADCSTLYENQKLLIPQPTPTPSPPATSTLTSGEATEAACDKYDYIVQENDTLSSIAANFQVPADAIRNYNGLVADIVRFGQRLIIPLCYREAAPGGPTPTPTIPPPYPAVNLLLPPDGAPFNLGEKIISVQWASVGALRENEAYAVTIEDVTQGEGRKLVLYVVDTKAIIPESFLVSDNMPHVIRWWVLTVRQTGTDDTGNPIWEPAGAVSASRVFTWLAAIPAVTPTP
jgi:LysM repeat protein